MDYSNYEFRGTNRPMSEKALEKLKEEIRLSEQQTKEDSKIDESVLRVEFNS